MFFLFIFFMYIESERIKQYIYIQEIYYSSCPLFEIPGSWVKKFRYFLVTLIVENFYSTASTSPKIIFFYTRVKLFGVTQQLFSNFIIVYYLFLLSGMHCNWSVIVYFVCVHHRFPISRLNYFRMLQFFLRW